MASDDDLIFQIIDWQEYNEKTRIELEGQIDYRTKKPREVNPMRYFINLFGRTADEKSVCLRIEDFRPYFFIEIPEDWRTSQIDSFIANLNRLISSKKMHLKICSADE
jgi:DNA polymerase elongation subunit (family B)